MGRKKKKGSRFITPGRVMVGMGIFGAFVYFVKHSNYYKSLIENTISYVHHANIDQEEFINNTDPKDILQYEEDKLKSLLYGTPEPTLRPRVPTADEILRRQQEAEMKRVEDEYQRTINSGLTGIYAQVPVGKTNYYQNTYDEGDFMFPRNISPPSSLPSGDSPPSPLIPKRNEKKNEKRKGKDEGPKPPTKKLKDVKPVSAGLEADDLNDLTGLLQQGHAIFKSRLGDGTKTHTALGTVRSGNKMEEIVRDIFEHTFGISFYSIRPKFLKNPTTGKNLELDGYNPRVRVDGLYSSKNKRNSIVSTNTQFVRKEGGRVYIKLAFEYDGAQHSKFTPAFHSSEEKFKYQYVKDKWKNKRCNEEGVIVIRIPHNVSETRLVDFICRTLDSILLEGYAQILRETVR